MIRLAQCSDFSPQFFAKILPLLPPEKQTAIAGIKHELSRRQSALGWALLALERTRRSLPPRAALQFTEHGKPVFADGAFHFNLSHSGDFVCLAVSDAPVGVDIQETATPSDALKTRVLCEAERAALSAAADPAAAFTALWACKESYLKFRGTGIADALDALDFSAALLSPTFRFCGAQVQLWQTPDYALALCGENADRQLQRIRPEDFAEIPDLY